MPYNLKLLQSIYLKFLKKNKGSYNKILLRRRDFSSIFTPDYFKSTKDHSNDKPSLPAAG